MKKRKIVVIGVFGLVLAGLTSYFLTDLNSHRAR